MPTLTFKDSSVRFTSSMLQDERVIRILVGLLETAPSLHGDVVVITSARDGRHSVNSRHYVGLAVDVRSIGNRTGAPIDESSALWVARLKQYLGKDYVVLNEPDHIHIQYGHKET